MRIIFFSLLNLPFLATVSAQEKPATNSRPNIVFILADDLGYGDIGAYGQKLIKTPNIDKLSKQGMRFTDFYAGSTVCAPSRATIMTGLHTGKTFIRGNGELPLRETDSILPQQLHKAGYVNGMVGKWGLGLANTTGAPEKKGWDFFSGHLHHEEGHFQHPDSAWQIRDNKSVHVRIPDGKFANAWFKDEAIRFIRESRKQPFFLYASFTLPHAELAAPDRYLKQYLTKDGKSKFQPEVPQPGGRHYGPQPNPKAAYAAMVSELDDYVGQIQAALKKMNLDKNTIVIFASDNGTHIEGGRMKSDADEFFKSSGPLRGIKRDLYEGGIRIPFIVKWDGMIKAGTTSSYTGAFWDLESTFMEIAGLQSPHNDGMSFLPVLKGQSQSGHKYLYWEFYEEGFKQAVREGNWKAIRYFVGGKPQRTELYDLAKDIAETNNLASSNQNIVTELEALMDQAHSKSESALFQVK